MQLGQMMNPSKKALSLGRIIVIFRPGLAMIVHSKLSDFQSPEARVSPSG
jgi:hypothetical protein